MPEQRTQKKSDRLGEIKLPAREKKFYWSCVNEALVALGTPSNQINARIAAAKKVFEGDPVGYHMDPRRLAERITGKSLSTQKAQELAKRWSPEKGEP